MKYFFPSKTFLLGEYAALSDGPSLLLTTHPRFSVEKTKNADLCGIHPESPAGLFWKKTAKGTYGLRFSDPLNGLGGLGASSAQFIGAWCAHYAKQHLYKKSLLDDYWTFAWNGIGQKPSGYDVLSQTQYGCVYIHQKQNIIRPLEWPFSDVGFLLIHTRQKLATHEHLQNDCIPDAMHKLGIIAKIGYQALLQSNASRLIDAVCQARSTLEAHHLTASHTLNMLKRLETFPGVLALKGCGAMGADIIALLCQSNKMITLRKTLEKDAYTVIASSTELHTQVAQLSLQPHFF